MSLCGKHALLHSARGFRLYNRKLVVCTVWQSPCFSPQRRLQSTTRASPEAADECSKKDSKPRLPEVVPLDNIGPHQTPVSNASNISNDGKHKIRHETTKNDALDVTSKLMKLVLQVRRSNAGFTNDNEFFRLFNFVEHSVLNSNATVVPPSVALKLVELSVQYLVLTSTNENKRISQAIRLYWHVMHRKRYFLDPSNVDDNSILVGHMLVGIFSRKMMKRPKGLFEFKRMINTVKQLLSAGEYLRACLLLREAQIKFHVSNGEIQQALQVLDRMVEEWTRREFVGQPNNIISESFHAVIPACSPDIAVRIVEDMVKLYRANPQAMFFRPNHISVSKVMISFTYQSSPSAGFHAEEFLRWALSCHEKGWMDLSLINMTQAMEGVIHVWSLTYSPDAGTRSDILVDRIISQYIEGGRNPAELPSPGIFASNCAAHIRNSTFGSHDNEIFEKLSTAMEKMQDFGAQEGWDASHYIPVFWRVLELLEEASKRHRSDEQEQINRVVSSLVSRMERLQIPLQDFVKRFRISPSTST